MVELFKKINVDWLGKRKLFLAISAALILVGMISLVAKGGFRYGVDFKGGTVVTVRFQETPQVDAIRQLLRDNGAADSQIQELRSGRNDILIEFQGANEQDASVGRDVILTALNKGYAGKFEILSASSIGP